MSSFARIKSWCLDLDRLSSYHFVTVAHDDAGTLEGRKIVQDSAEWFWCRHQHYGIDMTTECFLDLVSYHPHQQLDQHLHVSSWSPALGRGSPSRSGEESVGVEGVKGTRPSDEWDGSRSRYALLVRAVIWIYFRSLKHL